MNPGCRIQDQLNTSEPTTPYIIGRELNLRKLPGRQWESNPQPSEQLRPVTIKTSASTETATTAYTTIGKRICERFNMGTAMIKGTQYLQIHPKTNK